MPAKERGCALLADRHLGLVEGVRGLLETEFEAVVVVGDEVSLFESARQLHVALAVVDLSLQRGDGLGLVRRIRSQFPQLKLIVLSVHEEKNAELAVVEAGANGFVLKRSIATDLLPTIDVVLAEAQPDISKSGCGPAWKILMTFCKSADARVGLLRGGPVAESPLRSTVAVAAHSRH